MIPYSLVPTDVGGLSDRFFVIFTVFLSAPLAHRSVAAIFFCCNQRNSPDEGISNVFLRNRSTVQTTTDAADTHQFRTQTLTDHDLAEPEVHKVQRKLLDKDLDDDELTHLEGEQTRIFCTKIWCIRRNIDSEKVSNVEPKSPTEGLTVFDCTYTDVTVFSLMVVIDDISIKAYILPTPPVG
eukprot:gene39725-49093_t